MSILSRIKRCMQCTVLFLGEKGQFLFAKRPDFDYVEDSLSILGKDVCDKGKIFNPKIL